MRSSTGRRRAVGRVVGADRPISAQRDFERCLKRLQRFTSQLQSFEPFGWQCGSRSMRGSQRVSQTLAHHFPLKACFQLRASAWHLFRSLGQIGLFSRRSLQRCTIENVASCGNSISVFRLFDGRSAIRGTRTTCGRSGACQRSPESQQTPIRPVTANRQLPAEHSISVVRLTSSRLFRSEQVAEKIEDQRLLAFGPDYLDVLDCKFTRRKSSTALGNPAACCTLEVPDPSAIGFL